MKRILKKLGTVAAIALLSMPLAANNIAVSNVAITARDDANKYIEVTFDITWDNSFRTTGLSPDNWDAAWVFMKFKKTGAATAFSHCKLDDVANHSLPDTVNYELVQPADSMGVFIQRKTAGSGTVTLTGCKLRWNYTSATTFDPTNPIDVKVFALEMVYVPTGAFKVGSGGTETNSFTAGPWSSGATTPFTISSENSLSINNAAGALWATGAQGSVSVLPAEFPKGFKGFYCMKYELTQKAYVDFLNSLSRRQQNWRINLPYTASGGTGNGHIWNTEVNYWNGSSWLYDVRFVMGTSQTGRNYRNGIRCKRTFEYRPYPITFACDLGGGVNDDNYATSNQADDGQQVACNYLNTMHAWAYLDWAGLRPMSELEYEKACRGTANPVPNEYVWGTTNYIELTNVTNSGQVGETALNPAANCNFSSTNMAVRVGMYASPASSRTESGATFWGIQNMGGNVSEPVMSVGVDNNRFFSGAIHGDGKLTATGDNDVAGWQTACGYRGGGHANGPGAGCTSHRSFATTNYDINSAYYLGCRGVRTAP
ncbi:MAG TPA: SUMF1/EgtB/PvdO family nonheme iron enzyme [Paludibacter sp.]|nr:SUMF1/EgtB/PvdO family nonheme iron enzyme [Paludibacter sp.]